MKRFGFIALLWGSFFTFVSAGLTDFKTIEKANKAYQGKEYTKSQTLLESLDTNLV